MSTKGIYVNNRMSSEDLVRFMEEISDNKWVCLSPEESNEEPMCSLNIMAFCEKYDMDSLNYVVPWFSNELIGRGYLAGKMKLVHSDDHAVIVKQFNKARKVLKEIGDLSS